MQTTHSMQLSLLSGAISHLCHFAESGCPRAASQASMVLARLSELSDEPNIDASLTALERLLDHLQRS